MMQDETRKSMRKNASVFIEETILVFKHYKLWINSSLMRY